MNSITIKLAERTRTSNHIYYRVKTRV